MNDPVFASPIPWFERGGGQNSEMIAALSICWTLLEYVISLGDASNSPEYTYLLSDEL